MDSFNYCIKLAYDKYQYLGVNQEDLNKQLIEAAKSFDTDKLQSLINAGANVNATVQEYCHDFSTGYGKHVAVSPLSAVIKGPDYKDFRDAQLKSLAILVDAGAKIDNQLLILSAKTGNTWVLEFLLGKGADINTQDSEGKTALMYAAKRLEVDVIKILLKHKASVTIKDMFNYTALHYACSIKAPRQFTIDTLTLLVSANKSLLKAYTCSFQTPLMIAASHDSVCAVDFLIAAGSDLNQKGGNTKKNEHLLAFALSARTKNVLLYMLNLFSQAEVIKVVTSSSSNVRDKIDLIYNVKAEAIHGYHKKMFEIIWPLMRKSEEQDFYNVDVWYTILSQPALYPTWYKDQIKDAINLIFNQSKKIQNTIQPEPVVFLSKKRKADALDNLDDNHPVTKKSKPNDIDSDNNKGEMTVEGGRKNNI